MFCVKCGKEVSNEGNFCHHCGNKIKNETVIITSEKSIIQKSTKNNQKIEDKIINVIKIVVATFLLLGAWSYMIGFFLFLEKQLEF